MNRHKLDTLAQKLASLNEVELCVVLSKVLPSFEPYRNDPITERSGLFLGAFAVEEGRLKIDVVAYPPESTPWESHHGWNGLCQRTSSEIAGVDYVSHRKNGISPFDNESVYLT